MTHRDVCTRRIFARLQASDRLSQRDLSRELGVALGLTNTLLRGMIRSGWVEVVRDANRRLRYKVTAAGLAEEAALSHRYFDHAVTLYGETRSRVRASLEALSRGWPPSWSAVPGLKRVAFFGADKLAEIAYLALKDTDLTLVAVFDEEEACASVGSRVFPVAVVAPSSIDADVFDCMLILSFDTSRRMPPSLAARGLPESRVAWL